MRIAACFIAALGMLAACSDDGGTTVGVQPTATVVGRVMDDRGEAVPGAHIEIVGSGLETDTVAGGRFTIDVTGLSGRPLYSRSKSKFCADVSKYATR